MADEKKLHVVEFRPERDNLPVLLASPSDGKVRNEQELVHRGESDFNLYLLNNRFLLPQKKRQPFYANMYHYKQYQTQKKKVFVKVLEIEFFL